VGQLALAVQDIDGNEDDAQLDAGQIQVDHLDAIGEIDAQAITGLEATLREQVGEPIAACVDVAEGIGDAFKLESGMAAPAGEGEIEKVKEIQRIEDIMIDRRQRAKLFTAMKSLRTAC